MPILFIHGMKDRTIDPDQFDEIWHETTSSQKAALFTQYEHVINHIKGKELLALVGNLFVDLDFDDFIATIGNPHKTIAHLSLTEKKLDHLMKQQPHTDDAPQKSLSHVQIARITP